MKIAKNLVVSAMVIHSSVACSEASSTVTEFGTVDMNLVLGNGQGQSSSDASTEVAGLHAETALAFVRHIEFYLPEGDCAPTEQAGDAGSDAGEGECSDKLRVEGPWVIDLMTGSATPSMDEIRVPAGAYRRVDVRFEDADKNAAKGLEVPEPLVDWTLVATGAYDGAAAPNFDMKLKFNEDARFQSESGIVVSANGAQEMVMALDVQRWLSVVSLDDCFEKERLAVVDDVLMIEDESKRCNAVENAIKEVMKHPNRLDE